MRFTRINSHTVNCIITADDMDEQGLSIEDIFSKSDESMAFLQEILARAAEEVDYRPSSTFLPMQIAVLPDQSISLTLSENPNLAIADMLKGLADRLRQFLEDITERTGLEATHSVSHDETGTHIDVRVGEEDAQANRLLPLLRYSEYVFSFDSIATAARFAATMQGMPPLVSSLYKDGDGVYYLHLAPKGAKSFADVHEEAAAYASLFIHASEYGSFVSVERRYVLHMQENMDLIIRDEAMERLSAL